MPTVLEPAFPASVIALAYMAVILLIAILIMLFRLSGLLSGLSAKVGKSSRSSKLEEQGTESTMVEVDPGTPFEEFLTEDPARRNLSKKEQFKAYRIWRAEKGLNWSK